MLDLYRALVRPLHEYGVQFWSPIKRAHVEHLEKIQARTTKLISSFRHKGYQRRVADLDISSKEASGPAYGEFVNMMRKHGYKFMPPNFSTVHYSNFPTIRVRDL